MRPEQVYAIVDIEATGGSVGADERIIQFACVLLKDGEIIHTFETLVNPEKNIPKRIVNLTGISSKAVKKAPYFEEIVPIIYNLLEDAIFVAHNVGFDYRFLNEQLKNHGFQPFNIPAIDTVELSQIIYPTMDSFQLEDITAYLGYELVDAHDALADAEATCFLFEKLFAKAVSLPLVTLEKINELADSTTYQTSIFFKEALSQAYESKSPLSGELMVVNQLALKKYSKAEKRGTYQLEQEYPKSRMSKEKLYKDQINYQKNQTMMMDLIYDYLEEELSLNKLAIEAPAGTGKSYGYMLPAIFSTLKNKQSTVVSTYTTILQDQLINETVPKLESILDKKLDALVIKSSNYYLSLDIFSRWLKTITSEDSEAYLCMRILVWLTETTTGDLTEINAGSYLDLPFWKSIRATRNQLIDNKWAEVEFYERIKENAKNAEIIITNHHFLINDWKNSERIIPSLNQLIIDEAHHFPKVTFENNTTVIKGSSLIDQLEKIGSLPNETKTFKFITMLVRQNKIKEFDLYAIERTHSALLDAWQNLFFGFTEYYAGLDLLPTNSSQFVQKEFNLSKLSFNQQKWIKSIHRNIEEFLYVGHKISDKGYQSIEKLDWENQLLLIEFKELLGFVKDWYKNFADIFVLSNKETNMLSWVSYLPNKLEESFQIHSLKRGTKNYFIDYLATHSKVVFTSGTLSVENKIDYFSEELNNLPLIFHQLSGPFDYGKQVRLFVSEDKINPINLRKQEYADKLVNSIQEILSGRELNTIILFNSFEILNKVYKALIAKPELSNYLIMGQSISGTNNRIIKQFKRHNPAIILGVDSFYEGIDLPNDLLQLVIMTRLPFPSPHTPIMQLKTNHLKKIGEDPFLDEMLPQAILKFKQAFGRLIRNSSDQGVFVILDDRFMSASYANHFKNSLPKDVIIEKSENKLIGQKIEQFIQTNK